MREIEAQAIEKARLAAGARSDEKRKRRFAERRKGWSGVHAKASSSNEQPVAVVHDKALLYEEIEIG